MAKVRLKKISKEREFLMVADLAHEIWREHYAGIVSADQVEYMLEKFQSPSAINAAVTGEGYEYYLIRKGLVPIGYVGIRAHQPQGKLFLSKFYILKEYRGQGHARDVITELSEMAKDMRIPAIWLTASKKNASSIAAYEHLGFRKTGDVCNDIGNGFVMDDYVFEMEV
ncbi:MAG: GNAT family N-acetyltransferase [Christensenella sp.]|uniref:GNAT family N-acetyltransferase n=1 Tax=Christensenella sp. TaxID=1935934 RepID=UPI002B20ED23|nr:GNAT family N-acetyltransferase [Christensenella sp.]MEA5004444.1 GNAT family N-acetyltransferase [Christensenella sp.]